MCGREVVEVTEAVDFAIVGDRLHFTLTSGAKQRTFAICFHRARCAAAAAVRLLNDGDRQTRIYHLAQRDDRGH